MNSPFKAATGQIGNLGRHVAKQIIRQPAEILKTATGQNQTQSENQALGAMEQGFQTGNQNSSSGPNSSPSPSDPQIQQYADLAQQRDQLELAKIRRQLHHQYGLPVDLETSMEKARQERQQKKEQAEQIEEQKKEQEKLILEEQKKQESNQVMAAKAQSSAEMGIGRKIAG